MIIIISMIMFIIITPDLIPQLRRRRRLDAGLAQEPREENDI